MNVVIDTHALFWYITKDSKLSKTAEPVIATATKRFVPTIVLLEVLYLLQKQHKEREFSKILTTIKKETAYIIVSLDLVILETVPKISRELEMHDRIITATAKLLNVSIVTKDPAIKKVYKHTLW